MGDAMRKTEQRLALRDLHANLRQLQLQVRKTTAAAGRLIAYVPAELIFNELRGLGQSLPGLLIQMNALDKALGDHVNQYETTYPRPDESQVECHLCRVPIAPDDPGRPQRVHERCAIDEQARAEQEF